MALLADCSQPAPNFTIIPDLFHKTPAEASILRMLNQKFTGFLLLLAHSFVGSHADIP